MVDETNTAFRSIVVMCPFDHLVQLVKPFDSIAAWGCGTVSEAFIENTMGPVEEGAIRTVVLVSSQRVTLRERLLSIIEEPQQRGMKISWESLPTPLSPLPRAAENLVTEMTLTPITEDIGRTMVTMRATYSCKNAADGAVLKSFLEDQLLKPLLQCLAEVALVSAYATDPRREDTYFAQLKKFEADLNELKVIPTLEGSLVLKYEELLSAWVGMARGQRQLEGRLKAMEDEVEAARWTVRASQDLVVEKEREMADREKIDEARQASVTPSAKAREAIQAVLDSVRTVHSDAQESPMDRIMKDAPPDSALAKSALLSGCVITEEQLQAAWKDLAAVEGVMSKDTDGAQMITSSAASTLYDGMERFGCGDNSSDETFMDRWMKQHGCSGGMRYEHFSLLMLQLAQQ